MSEKDKVFCIGLIKTGTTTLATSLRQLGYSHLAYNRNHVDLWTKKKDLPSLIKITENYDSFSDWPWSLIYEELDREFPNSKFILTRRVDEITWLESLKRHSMQLTPSKNVRKEIFGHAYPFLHEQDHLDFYRNHLIKTRAYFSNKLDRFIELCWEDGDGWEELCSFLNHKMPDIPFPHTNKAAPLSALSLNIWKNRMLRLFQS